MSSKIAPTNQLLSLLVDHIMHICCVYSMKHHQLLCDLISTDVKWTSDDVKEPQSSGSEETERNCFRINSNLLWIQKYSCHITNEKFGWHNMASVPVYCLCRLPYDVTRFMIECDICQDWFHGRWVFWRLYHLVMASVCIWKFVLLVQLHHLCNVLKSFLCSCVGVEEDKAAEIDLYHCPNCQVTHGPSVSKSSRSPSTGLSCFFFFFKQGVWSS